MALQKNEGLMPSVLDRLLDPDSAGTAWRRGYGMQQMMQAVQRDLEELLNTRQSHQGLPDDLVELHRSIFAYGLPELTSLNATTTVEREAIGMILEQVVMKFEPRLRNVRATLEEYGDGKERHLRFRIDAKLSVDPCPEVAFETVLELMTGHYSVKPTST
jgi:type VI secretion system protein ImpF